MSGTGISSTGNNPPSTPLLVYPANNQTGLGETVEFRWKKSTDPDGDTVTYDLYYCDDPNFTGCTPINAAFLWNKKDIYYAGIDSYGTGLLLIFGIALVLTGRIGQWTKTGTRKRSLRKRRKTEFLIVMIMIATVPLVSCGGSSGSTSGNGTSNEVSYSVSGLDPNTTYYWKVVAKDGNGNETKNCVWSFTTAP